ncbi:reverse transcriptase domain-containing protein [Tanacetum coccineum]|uniref:Reverse transcriptase domain-containing protein n=1 Tax=Tanacetum coccineum TaxID=301880 RepID=A0ABQ5C191_9ASTR
MIPRFGRQKKLSTFSKLAIMDPPGDITVQISPPERSLMSDSFGLQYTRMHTNFMGPFPSSRGNKHVLVEVDYLSKWVEAKALPTNDARVVCKFLKSLFARFGAPRAIICDRGTHFCNDQFAKWSINRASWSEQNWMTLSGPSYSVQIPIGCNSVHTLVYGNGTVSAIELEARKLIGLNMLTFDLKTGRDQRKVQLNELVNCVDQAYDIL